MLEAGAARLIKASSTNVRRKRMSTPNRISSNAWHGKTDGFTSETGQGRCCLLLAQGCGHLVEIYLLWACQRTPRAGGRIHCRDAKVAVRAAGLCDLT